MLVDNAVTTKFSFTSENKKCGKLNEISVKKQFKTVFVFLMMYSVMMITLHPLQLISHQKLQHHCFSVT